MSEVKSEIDSDIEQNYSISSNTVVDPKNMAELSLYVCDFMWAIPHNGILIPSVYFFFSFNHTQVQTLLQGVQDKFQNMSDQIISRIDEMGTRIDELEKGIEGLMNQAGVEGQCEMPKWPITEMSNSYSNEKF